MRLEETPSMRRWLVLHDVLVLHLKREEKNRK